MTRFWPVLLLLLVGACATLFSFAQEPWDRQANRPPGENNTRLPSGRLQSEEILKLDHEQNLKDLKNIQKLADEIKADMDKNDRYVLSIGTLKKLEEIEKMSQRIRGRMKRW